MEVHIRAGVPKVTAKAERHTFADAMERYYPRRDAPTGLPARTTRSAISSSRSANLYPAVVLALSTGMRRSEIMFLTWQQVDLAAGVIILSETNL